MRLQNHCKKYNVQKFNIVPKSTGWWNISAISYFEYNPSYTPTEYDNKLILYSIVEDKPM